MRCLPCGKVERQLQNKDLEYQVVRVNVAHNSKDESVKLMKSIAIGLLITVPGVLFAGNKSIYHKVETYPERVSSSCRDGVAQIYDECTDQTIILRKAIKKSEKTGKSVLVVYGAEWCIWCHVFDKYVKGHSRKFKYEWQYQDGDNLDWKMKERENKNAKQEAKKLNKYVSENFILVHIESYRSPNGAEAAQRTGFNPENFSYVPVIFSLDRSGNYAAHMLAYNSIPGMEIREDSGRDFRGFDRDILLTELTKLRTIASR